MPADGSESRAAFSCQASYLCARTRRVSRGEGEGARAREEEEEGGRGGGDRPRDVSQSRSARRRRRRPAHEISLPTVCGRV
jgi:hypothetical protein